MLKLPKEIKEPLDEIKTPSNKILIICLIFTIIVMFGILSKKENDQKEKDKKAEEKYDRLNKQLVEMQNEQINYFKGKISTQDTIKATLNIKQ